jgi:hypothetical protein
MSSSSVPVEFGEVVPLVSLSTLQCAVCHAECEQFGVTPCSKPLQRAGHEPNCCFNCWTRHFTHSSACPLCRAEVAVVYAVSGVNLTEMHVLFATLRQVRQSGPGPRRTDQSLSYRVVMRATPNHVVVAGMGVNGVHVRLDASTVGDGAAPDRRVVVDVNVVVDESSDSDSERPLLHRRRVLPVDAHLPGFVRAASLMTRFPGHAVRQLNGVGVRVNRNVLDEMSVMEVDTQAVAYRVWARHCVYAAVLEQGRATRTIMCGLTLTQLLGASFMVTDDGLCKSCLFPVGLHQ